MTTIYLSNNADALRAISPTVTVEAEYGDVCAMGSRLTLAHHGPRANNVCPAISWAVHYTPAEGPLGQDWSYKAGYTFTGLDGTVTVEFKEARQAVVGVSHFDLDTLLGCLPFIKPNEAYRNYDPRFYKLAAFVDVETRRYILSGCLQYFYVLFHNILFFIQAFIFS